MRLLSTIKPIEIQAVTRTLITDVLVLFSFYATIIFAHILPFPLYKLDPMKILVLGTVIYSSRNNAMFMAAILHVLSFFSTGHPVFPKFLIMSSELAIFAWVLGTLQSSRIAKPLGFLSAIFVSKLFYYLIKGGAISLGFLDQNLLSTSIATQMQALAILGGVFLLFDYLNTRFSK